MADSPTPAVDIATPSTTKADPPQEGTVATAESAAPTTATLQPSAAAAMEQPKSPDTTKPKSPKLQAAADGDGLTTGPEPAPVEVDVDTDLDNDSAYGDELSSYTGSLNSSVLNYNWEHGRRYHAYGGDSYILPNDEVENNRLDMTHHMLLLLTDKKLHLAPIGEHPQRILDIGTGTGIWAMEMGDKYPSASIIGNDLSPIQPQFVPPNVGFEIDDVEQPWIYNHDFDYIHSRYMATAIADWPKLIGQAFKFTAPGGWAEFQDFDLQYYSEDDSLAPELAVTRWINELLDGCRRVGREPCPGPKLLGWMRDAGFTQLHHQRFVLPIGTWPKDPVKKQLGAWNFMQIDEGLEAFTLRLFTKVLGWDVQEVTVLLAMVRKDLKNRRVHAQFDFHVVYGQKPEA